MPVWYNLALNALLAVRREFQTKTFTHQGILTSKILILEGRHGLPWHKHHISAEEGFTLNLVTLFKIPIGRKLADPAGSTEYVKWDKSGYVY